MNSFVNSSFFNEPLITFFSKPLTNSFPIDFLNIDPGLSEFIKEIKVESNLAYLYLQGSNFSSLSNNPDNSGCSKI